jgi:hypothetical protein
MVVRFVLCVIQKGRQEATMSMYFYDETDDWPEYKIAKDIILRMEKEHLKIRK